MADPTLEQLIERINAVQSLGDEKDLDALGEAVDAVFRSRHPERAVKALLRVFERFPEHGDFGLCWSILHGLENLRDHYEIELLQSLKRAPSDFAVTMVNRILNSGQLDVHGVSLITCLQEVAMNRNAPPAVCEQASAMVRRHLLNDE